MYDAIAEASGVNVPPAEPAATADFGEVAKMVDGTLQSPALLEGGVGRLVKQAGADTTLKNAARDGIEFAWIPSGDTCPFCLTLASRGWQRAKKSTRARHIHAHCNCEYAIRFDSETSIAGYDPDAYLDQYYEYGGDINAMRRARYAKDKDKINAQKRAAYALRQKNRGKKIAITDIAIQKVPMVTPPGVDEQTAVLIQKAHKDLLTFAKDNNNSDEVACLLDLTTGKRLPFVKGDQISVDIEADADSYHSLRNMPSNSLMLCHNHPGQSYFSDNDVVLFMKYQSIGTMSIVTNQGKVWTISKTDAFDFKKAFSNLKECFSKYEGNPDKAIDKFLKRGYNYGIKGVE